MTKQDPKAPPTCSPMIPVEFCYVRDGKTVGKPFRMFCLAVPRVGELFVPEQGSTMFIVELVSHRAKTVHGIQSSRPFVYLRDTAANEMISSLLKEL